VISAVTGSGLPELVRAIAARLASLSAPAAAALPASRPDRAGGRSR
jgi:hypothetical protein